MSIQTQITDKEMWAYLAQQEQKTIEEVTAAHANDAPDDLRELKAYVLSEQRSDAIEETIDCYTLGVHVARLVADELSSVCSRTKNGRLVYQDGWSDERVVRSLTEGMVKVVERIREDFKGSPLIDCTKLPLSVVGNLRLPALTD
jgi:hypothetical protein